MPIGMISKRARSLAEARGSRGYQSSGVAILRPSCNVTTSSVAVNSTERARRSPTSISKVLIPGARQCVAILLQMTDDIANFMGREHSVDGHTQVMKPKFGLLVSAADMDM